MKINTLLSIGSIFLLGLIFSGLIRKIKMPSITAYMILGILIGPNIAGLISPQIINSSALISNIVLSFIAFSIGQNLSLQRFREIGNDIVAITIGQGLGAVVFVTGAIYLLTRTSFVVALCYGTIATATAPAAIVMVVREFRAKGKFTNTLLGVVALDDGLGLILFALVLAVIKSLSTVQDHFLQMAFSGIIYGCLEVFGAIILGVILGALLSYFSRFLTNTQEFLIYTLGFIIFNSGLSLFFGFSVLLSNMAMGGILVNINKTSFRFFESLRSIDTPFYLLFFVLAGANLDLGLINSMGLVGGIYIIARMIGKITGTFLSGTLIGTRDEIRKYLGIGLAPQAGVAVGMAMIVKNVLPENGSVIMSTIIATTMVYEIIGPVMTKYALQKVHNIE
ncbi:cation:proton antiporter [Elusimicrobiota bacterium]